ncbi:MAG: LysM domain-containing protein [Pseudomonadota bacterium]
MKKTLSASFLVLLIGAATAQVAQQAQASVLATTTGPPEYMVRAGDSLWDVSARFFGTPWVWPKLWEQNPQVTNPNVLEPGLRLRLYVEGYQILPAARSAAAQPAATPGAVSANPFEYLADTTGIGSLIEDVGYLATEKMPPMGRISGDKDPLRTTVSEGDLVFVRFDAHKPQTGDLFRVLSVSEEPIVHPITEELMGYKHTFPAVLEVVEVNGQTATAKVIQAHREFEVGDGVVSWFPMPKAVTLKKCTRRVEGRLITGQRPTHCVSQGNLVFLDLGSELGIEPGDVFDVWREIPDMEAINLSVSRIGQVVVVLVRPGSSTALVTMSTQDILEGAVVRPEP